MDLFRRKTSPPPKEAAAKGMFKARATQDLQTVTIKLAAVEAEIAMAEAALRDASLAAALAEPNTDAAGKGFEAIGQLQALRANKELLLHARAKAQEAENARLNELRSKADKARERALTQHMATLEKEAAIASDACQALQAAFDKMAAAQSSVAALTPARLRSELTGQLGILTLEYLRMLINQNLGKLGRASPTPLVQRFSVPHERRTDGFIPELVDTVKSITGIKARLVPIPEIAPVASSAGADALAPTVPHPAVGGDAAAPDDLEGGEGINHMPSSPSPAYTEQSEAF
jgi:hypothetical protein